MMQRLPKAAMNEVETALEEGFYEAAPPLYLPNVIDLQETYLQKSDPLTFYRASIDREGDVARLTVDRTVPTQGHSSLDVTNASEAPREIELMIDYVEPSVSYAEVDTPKRVVDESLSLDSGNGSSWLDAPTVETTAFDRLTGKYEATVVTDTDSETIEYTEPYQFAYFPQRGFALGGTDDRITVSLIEQPVKDDIICSRYWYDE